MDVVFYIYIILKVAMVALYKRTVNLLGSKDFRGYLCCYHG